MLLKHEVKAVLSWTATASDKQLQEKIVSIEATKFILDDKDAIQSANWILSQINLELSARAEVKNLSLPKIDR